MKVYRYELEDGTLQQLIFRADTGENAEDQAALKAAVKSWITTNYPAVGWEQFYDRLITLEGNRIIVDMTS